MKILENENYMKLKETEIIKELNLSKVNLVEFDNENKVVKISNESPTEKEFEDNDNTSYLFDLVIILKMYTKNKDEENKNEVIKYLKDIVTLNEAQKKAQKTTKKKKVKNVTR